MRIVATVLILVGLAFASSRYWRIEPLTDGRVRVICANGGDATIEATDVDHSIIVSCGTR